MENLLCTKTWELNQVLDEYLKIVKRVGITHMNNYPIVVNDLTIHFDFSKTDQETLLHCDQPTLKIVFGVIPLAIEDTLYFKSGKDLFCEIIMEEESIGCCFKLPSGDFRNSSLWWKRKGGIVIQELRARCAQLLQRWEISFCSTNIFFTINPTKC